MSVATMAGLINEHMEVVCSRGMHVGTVDHVQGDRIQLTTSDSADGEHHWFPASMVAAVDTRVHLLRSRDELHQVWTSE